MLGSEERLQRALALAYRHLNRRDRTEAEVRRHLDRHDVAAAVVDQAICVLVDQGYVDDARFARLYVQDQRQLQHWGGERIRRGLAGRGIDRDLIEEALAAESDPGEARGRQNAPGFETDHQRSGELGRAVALLRRRFPVPPRDRHQRDRALGVLLRKGYNSELAVDALASYARDPRQQS